MVLDKDARTYADALSKPCRTQVDNVRRSNGLATGKGAGGTIGCMRCGEQGHMHWTCFGDVHESRLWGRDPKRRPKRWRRSDTNVLAVSVSVEITLDAVNNVDEI